MSSQIVDGKTVWFDGKLVSYPDSAVPMLSHSLHYGSAGFEGVRSYGLTGGGAAIFRATEHMQRLHASMATLNAKISYSAEELVEACRAMISANHFTDCYIRPIAYIDDAVRGLKLPPQPQAKVAIAAWNWGKYLGNDAQERGISAMISTFRRGDAASSMPWAKLAANYLVPTMARGEATRHGHDEAILLDQQGFVAEGSGENIFMIKGGALVTPTTTAILPGITRDSVFTIARHLGLSVTERNITRNELYQADEAFFTGTAVEVTPIRAIDGRNIGAGGVGPISRQIRDLFFQIVRGEVPAFKSWLTKV